MIMEISIRGVISPYGCGHVAEHIARKIIGTLMNGRIGLKKKFYDLKI